MLFVDNKDLSENNAKEMDAELLSLFLHLQVESVHEIDISV
jgi:hypothetical protein